LLNRQLPHIIIPILIHYPTLDDPHVGITWRWILCSTLEGQLELCLQALPCAEGMIKSKPALDNDNSAAIAVARLKLIIANISI